eukprot:scaffold14519_cov135-Isochrysis_galbana.AAC.9
MRKSSVPLPPPPPASCRARFRRLRTCWVSIWASTVATCTPRGWGARCLTSALAAWPPLSPSTSTSESTARHAALTEESRRDCATSTTPCRASPFGDGPVLSTDAVPPCSPSRELPNPSAMASSSISRSARSFAAWTADTTVSAC